MARLKEAEWKGVNNVLHCPPCTGCKLQRRCLDPSPGHLRRGCSSSCACLWVQMGLVAALVGTFSEPEAQWTTGLHAMVTWPAGRRGGVGFLLCFPGYTLQAVLNMPSCWAGWGWVESHILKTLWRSSRIRDLTARLNPEGEVLHRKAFGSGHPMKYCFLLIIFLSISVRNNRLFICYLVCRVIPPPCFLSVSHLFLFWKGKEYLPLAVWTISDLV